MAGTIKPMEDSDRTSHHVQSKAYRIVKTLTLVITYICIGLFDGIIGPTLIDLRILTGENYDNLSFALAGLNIGVFIGCFAGGVLIDKLDRFGNLFIAVGLDIAAAGTIGIPLVHNYWFIWLLSIVRGVMEGVINIVAQKLIMEMWLEKAASPLHLLHGGFGVGSFIIPLIANPFLAIPADKEVGNWTTNSTGSLQNISSTENPPVTEEPDIVYIRESRILYPYLIAAAITVTVSFVFYIYHFKERKSHVQKNVSEVKDEARPESVSVKQMFNPGTCTDGKVSYGLTVFSLVFLLFFMIVAGQLVSGEFVRTYAIEQLGFSTDDGSYINTIFWVSFTVGRMSGFITARWIPIRILILLETGGFLISSVLLFVYGTNSTWYWVLIQGIAFFNGPLYPSGIGLLNFLMNLTGVAISIPVLGASCGGLVFMKVIGYTYEYYGPSAFRYNLLGVGIGTFLVAVLMVVMGSQHRVNSHKNEQAESKLD